MSSTMIREIAKIGKALACHGMITSPKYKRLQRGDGNKNMLNKRKLK